MRRHKFVRIRLRVSEIIEERGITMAKLSRMSDLALNTIIAACKKPYRSVSIQTLVKIARALQVNVSDLYTVEDDT
jgi:lambda repressor-like predicted transcriptional regulator